MAATTVEQIRQLIATSELLAAAIALTETWQGKDESLYNLATVLLQRSNALEQETMQGIISRPDAELERAKIIDGLLFLTNRIQNPLVAIPRHLKVYFPEAVQKTTNWNRLILIASTLFVIAAASFLMQFWFKPTEFTLKIALKGITAGKESIAHQNVKLFFGTNFYANQELDAASKVIFTDIPIKFLQDSITLELGTPAYKIVRQSAATAAQSNKGSIIFEIEPVTQYTNWRGNVTNREGKPIVNAVLDIETGLVRDTTDTNGNFQIHVPKAVGEKVQVRIFVNEKPVRSSLFVLTEAIPTPITIE